MAPSPAFEVSIAGELSGSGRDRHPRFLGYGAVVHQEGPTPTPLSARPPVRRRPDPAPVPSHGDHAASGSGTQGDTPATHHPQRFTGGDGRRIPAGDRLRTAIGLAPDLTPVVLDLKEAVDKGIGPHGLITGPATPVLLRHVLLGLATSHTPDEASFVLLDGASPAASDPAPPFAVLGQLPHTEVVLGPDRPDLVPRLIEVLEGELSRRKRFLVAAQCSSHSEYLRAAASRPPLPALILVCHEVLTLVDRHPRLLELLRRVGWLGRARGIHLILTVADLADPDVRGLAGYLAYRVTAPAAGSPGLLSAGPHQPPRPFTLPDEPEFPSGAVPPPAHRIWVPPLDVAPALDDLAGPVVTGSDHLPRFADESLHGALQIPIAALDKPREHRRDTIWLPVAGHVAVAGGAGSGTSTFLRTAIAALALSHSPAAVRIIAPDSVPPDYLRIPLVHGVLGRSRPCVDELRDLHARLDAPDGDTVVLVDDWAEFWATRPEWHDLLVEIARRGSSRGVHLIAAATRWSDFDPRLADRFGSRLELRVAESAIDPAAAAEVPPDQPGRGIVDSPSGPLHFLTARPELAATPHDALIRSLSTDHCAECGFTYASVSAAALPARLRTAGSLYAAALLAASAPRRRPSPDVWSPLEYTCHVRDVLRVQRERLDLAVRADNPVFAPMGRDERALRDDYNGQDPYVVLTDVDLAAESLAVAFEALAPAQLSRTGLYSWPAPATRDLLWVGRHTVHEVVHHLRDIARQR
ncbi:FtsK/SpoIIIE domain-containing protein [Actinoplanes cyaneus]|nr:FtsK/SpoIIIE domain-containing protein [Actinoplanes cyaneus]